MQLFVQDCLLVAGIDTELTVQCEEQNRVNLLRFDLQAHDDTHIDYWQLGNIVDPLSIKIYAGDEEQRLGL